MFILNVAQNLEGKWKNRLAGTGTNGYEKGFGYYRSDRDPVPVLPAESNAYTGMGWRMDVEVVVSCAQHDGWKITSVDLNVKEF